MPLQIISTIPLKATISTHPFSHIYYPSSHFTLWLIVHLHLKYCYSTPISPAFLSKAKITVTSFLRLYVPHLFVTGSFMRPGQGRGLMKGDKLKSVRLKLEQWEVCRESVSIFPVSLQHGPLAAGRSLTFLLTTFRALLPPRQYEPIRTLVNTRSNEI